MLFMSVRNYILLFLILFAGLGKLMSQELIKPQPIQHPQNNDRQQQRLGIQYYQARNYDKAIAIFTDLYEKDPSHTNYTYYLYSLIEKQHFRDAEKLVRKQVKRYPVRLRYKVDLGFIYIRNSEPEKAQRKFDEVIKELPANINEIKQIANAFYLRNQTAYAIKTYNRGREVMKGEYPFSLELAGMYERNGNYPEMTEIFLDHLEDYPESRETVQNRLQSAMARDIEDILPGILREALLVRYQEDPDKVYLNELLLWLSLQQKDFAFAFIQARSLDKRFSEDGTRVLEIAELSMSNGDFDAALECYTYILDKGKNAPLYLNGLIGYLDARYQQITHNISIEHQELEKLESAYQEAIAEFGIHMNTIQLLRDLAHIQAFHLGKPEEAIANLNRSLEVPGPENFQKAQSKLELADIYLFSGEVWEATLLYSQVEKSFKNEPIGHEAKLKNARLTYYIGEFNWAKAQLDVLKAATAKLIANDALELSLLIADNIDSDSSYRGLMYYAAAELLFYQNKYEESLVTLDSILMMTAWHPLFDEVYYQKADILLRQGKYEKADSLLQKITYSYPDDILGDDALYKRARLHEEVFKDEARAMELYQDLLTDYPGSIYTMAARRKFRVLRGDEL